ncbi:MAG: hypothetical protein LBQ66_08695 [Planctomycetaceae bacterium]|jgi:hypothetical protein|nr:hypothetical protein [Planctomycetaceae bacterium]
MQTPEQVLDVFFLDVRYSLLEVAAMFDRFDDAVLRVGVSGDVVAGYPQRTQLEEAAKILTNCREANRVELMLNLFSDMRKKEDTQKDENTK